MLWKRNFSSPQFSEFVENDIEIGKQVKALANRGEWERREENDEIFMKKFLTSCVFAKIFYDHLYYTYIATVSSAINCSCERVNFFYCIKWKTDDVNMFLVVSLALLSAKNKKMKRWWWLILTVLCGI